MHMCTANLLDMCSHSSSTLLYSNVVSVAAEWDWSEKLSGMGCKYTVFESGSVKHDL